MYETCTRILLLFKQHTIGMLALAHSHGFLPTIPRAHRDEKRPDRYGGEAPAHWSPPRVEDLHKGKSAGRAARPMGRSQTEAVVLSAVCSARTLSCLWEVLYSAAFLALLCPG